MSEETCWLAWLEPGAAGPGGAWAGAEVHRADDGSAAGTLVAWRGGDRPVPGALQADPRALDPGGAAALVSLAWAPPGFSLLFDDGAVQRARHAVLEGIAPDAVTTLSRDASRVGGALTARRGDDALARLAEDPFARLLPTTLLRVGPGLAGAAGGPRSLMLERYGGRPWPADRFPAG